MYVYNDFLFAHAHNSCQSSSTGVLFVDFFLPLPELIEFAQDADAKPWDDILPDGSGVAFNTNAHRVVKAAVDALVADKVLETVENGTAQPKNGFLQRLKLPGVSCEFTVSLLPSQRVVWAEHGRFSRTMLASASGLQRLSQ